MVAAGPGRGGGGGAALAPPFPAAALDAQAFWPNAWERRRGGAQQGDSDGDDGDGSVGGSCAVDLLLSAWSGARLGDEVAVDCRWRPLAVAVPSARDGGGAGE